MRKHNRSRTIAPPKSADEIGRFLEEVAKHDDSEEVWRRLTRLTQEAVKMGGSDVTQWSRLKTAQTTALAAQRREIHERIVRSQLDDSARSESPIVVILLGPPGAGKTTVGVALAHVRHNVAFVNVNADDVKEALPEYEGWNAAALHAESTHVAEDIIKNEAAACRFSLIYDITGRDSAKVDTGIKEFLRYRYDVYLLLMDLAPWIAAYRAWVRFQSNPFGVNPRRKPGRYVPPEYVYQTVGMRPRETFDRLKNRKGVRGYCRVDASTPLGQEAKIVERREW